VTTNYILLRSTLVVENCENSKFPIHERCDVEAALVFTASHMDGLDYFGCTSHEPKVTPFNALLNHHEFLPITPENRVVEIRTIYMLILKFQPLRVGSHLINTVSVES